MKTCSSACISVISVLIFFPLCWCYELLDQISGSVSGGEAKFYTLDPRKISVLCLITEKGDADLYVAKSSLTSYPNSDLCEYSATSTSTDLVVVLNQEPLTIGVHGHVRYDTSLYQLLVLTPDEDDVQHHQVWEFDPESMKETLVIDIDPLWMANDPRLHATVHMLHHGETMTGQLGSVATALEWVFWFLLKVLQFGLEVLL